MNDWDKKRLLMTIWCLKGIKAWIIPYLLCYSLPYKPNAFIFKLKEDNYNHNPNPSQSKENDFLLPSQAQ